MPQVLLNSRTQATSYRRTGIIEAPAPLRLWHLASLDAPTVALVWSLAFAWVARVRLPLWVPALVMLAVFAVYVADRLLDARAGLQSPDSLRDRHHFHWRHRRILLPLAIAAACAAAWIVFNLMPRGARRRDSVLAAVSLLAFAAASVADSPCPFHRFFPRSSSSACSSPPDAPSPPGRAPIPPTPFCFCRCSSPQSSLLCSHGSTATPSTAGKASTRLSLAPARSFLRSQASSLSPA